jgi:glycine/D-amino acid oxidase-like deaminating enzyme
VQDDAGFAHHDAVVWAYAGAASRLGADIHALTTVEAIRMDGERVVGVSTSRGDVAADVVVDAAGGRRLPVGGRNDGRRGRAHALPRRPEPAGCTSGYGVGIQTCI